MNTKQLTYPSIESQKQYWIDKEAQSGSSRTTETRQALIAALEDVELRATQDKLACGIGKRKNQTAFLLGALERIRNAAREAIDASHLNKSDTTTADPKPEDLSRTESLTDWYDHRDDDYWSLRDEGRNPDGSGESYASRNV